jgi:tetratricopeptide (TPR) repeat protein
VVLRAASAIFPISMLSNPAPRIAMLILQAIIASALVAEEAQPNVRVAFLEKRTAEDPDDFMAWAQLAESCLQQMRETGDDRWLKKARRAANASLKAIPAKSNPSGLGTSARVALAEHRFADAKSMAEQFAKLAPGKPAPFIILADALLESGDLRGAEKTVAQLEEMNAPALVTQARRARICRLCGKLDEAIEHYEEARAAALEARQNYWVSWADVQLGEVEFSRGDWDKAEVHYRAALAKQPRWWVALEHLAELRGAQERDEEALEIYQALNKDSPRPELLQAVGDLHLARLRPTIAKPWHDRALAAYKRAAADGSLAMHHHLAGFYCDSQPNAAEAVKWARKDLELRDTAAARDALGWALYLSGDIAGAQSEIEKALGANPGNPHVLQHAGMIRISAGNIALGQEALREALRLNPRFQSFHVHR